uniref:Macroglobulin domain-containing protein n=1 Tax=Monopterus albus TaxID=43700 RepID=A0A3Q3QYI5_MONAL
MCVYRQYMVAIPAVLEAGATAKLCADLMQPNEALTMTTSLVYKKRTTLFKWASRKDLHTCAQFQVPLVQNDEVWNFEVEVQGSMFSSKEVRKVMIRVYQPMTFVQTDKPIYLPGQTVISEHFHLFLFVFLFAPRAIKKIV